MALDPRQESRKHIFGNLLSPIGARMSQGFERLCSHSRTWSFSILSITITPVAMIVNTLPG